MIDRESSNASWYKIEPMNLRFTNTVLHELSYEAILVWSSAICCVP